MNYHIVLVLSLGIATASRAETLTLRSGNGSGETDTLITFLDEPYNTDFGSSFSSTDFANAQAGPSAFIVAPNPIWLDPLPEDLAAHWIGTNPNAGRDGFIGDTALYAMSFNLPSKRERFTRPWAW